MGIEKTRIECRIEFNLGVEFCIIISFLIKRSLKAGNISVSLQSLKNMRAAVSQKWHKHGLDKAATFRTHTQIPSDRINAVFA